MGRPPAVLVGELRAGHFRMPDETAWRVVRGSIWRFLKRRADNTQRPARVSLYRGPIR
jgi:hypothetical protein